MNSDKWTKFRGYIGANIEWFLTVIIGIILSTAVIDIKNSILKFEIMLAIVIIASFGLLYKYGIDFYKDYKKIIQSERVPMDAILKIENKKVTFDDATFTENAADVKIFRQLYNNMTASNRIYTRYKIKIQSHDDVPHLEDITLTRGNSTTMVSKLDQDVTQPKQCLEIDRDELNISEPSKKIVEFFVPLYLKAGKTCNFEIIYRTKAYKNALQGKTDYIQMRVNRITNQLIIEVTLEGEMKNKFKISPCVDEDGFNLSHKIFDASLERMKKTESQLKGQPEYNGDNAIWEIKNPKIGYSYRMYFRLSPKYA